VQKRIHVTEKKCRSYKLFFTTVHEVRNCFGEEGNNARHLAFDAKFETFFECLQILDGLKFSKGIVFQLPDNSRGTAETFHLQWNLDLPSSVRS
jgi:hypothetical protein